MTTTLFGSAEASTASLLPHRLCRRLREEYSQGELLRCVPKDDVLGLATRRSRPEILACLAVAMANIPDSAN
eukprot:scaffold44_cov411-Prasinococcus_capsulatus_cf.AAC.48